jgi:small nuclear ribonucleoprotein (snRNP)-like protein
MEELAMLLDKNVVVETNGGKTYSGTLSGVDTKSMSICLTAAKDGQGRVIRKLFLSGGTITQIYSTEKPFDLASLAERLERVFPRMVRMMEGAGVIVVMDKIRVTEKGIVEGSGPAAERVQKVYEEFMRGQSG